MKPSFAIIGCGRIAKRHAEQINKVGTLLAVCDIVYENAFELAQQYNCNFYLSIEELLEKEPNVDTVSICTPNGLHAMHSIQSLQANKHVLCEKPLSISVADANNMIAASKRSHKKLFVVKSTRYNPIVLAVKNLINQNQLGKIFSFQLNCVWNRPEAYYKNSWKGSLALDGGTLFTQFSHYIDVILWFFGETKTLQGFRTNASHLNSIEFEDCGAIAVEMENGTLGAIHYSINAINKNQEVSLSIVAEKGTLKLGGEYLNELLQQEPALINMEELQIGNTANDYGFYKGSMSNHDKVYENIVKALNGQKSAFTDAEDALKTVAFIENFYNKTPVKNFPL